MLKGSRFGLISLLDFKTKSLDLFFIWPVLVKITTLRGIDRPNLLMKLFYQLCGQKLPTWRNIFVIEHGF